MNLWKVQGEKEEHGEQRKKGKNEESKLECLKLEFYVVPYGKLSTSGASQLWNSRI